MSFISFARCHEVWQGFGNRAWVCTQICVQRPLGTPRHFECIEFDTLFSTFFSTTPVSEKVRMYGTYRWAVRGAYIYIFLDEGGRGSAAPHLSLFSYFCQEI